MHIKNLTLEQFRGAMHLQLDLDEHLNVFVGKNGAGKSSILDAAAILLSWLVNRIKSPGASGRPIAELDDIRNEHATAILKITCNHLNEDYFWELAKTRRGYGKKDSTLSAMTTLAKITQDAIADANGCVNLPLFAYYPVNRAVLDIPWRIRERHSFDLLSAYDNSLTGGADFRTFFEWFRDREDLENETRRDQSQFFKPDPQLEAVRQALTRFMPEFTNLTVRRYPLQRMEVEKQGKRLTVNQLSDGEKCLMAMVGDMARRMAIANPLRSNPLEGDGIILIDEVDLHLHPKWQQMIIPQLLEVFPGCQFLLSTHSPHIITHACPENLFFLEASSEGLISSSVTESYGKTADRILEDLMGLKTTRPMEVNDALEQIYAHIDSGALAYAKNCIDELEQKIGKDPDLVKANVLIRRKEMIGK